MILLDILWYPSSKKLLGAYNVGTVGPRTERPQAEQTSQLNDFQLGPK